MKEGYGLPVDCCSYALPPVPRLHCALRVLSPCLPTFCVCLSLSRCVCGVHSLVALGEALELVPVLALVSVLAQGA